MLSSASSLFNATDYIFPVRIDHRSDLIAQSRARLSAAGRGDHFSNIQECEQSLLGLASYIRENLLTPLHRYLQADLTGECAWGQAVSMIAMEDLGLKPLACGRANSPRSDGAEHAFAVLPLIVSNEPCHFLFDLTYLQFCERYHHKSLRHGARFSRAQDLANKGFVKLTPKIAQEFLASFNDTGDHYNTPQAAMAFMLNCPFNDVFDRKEVRQAMAFSQSLKDKICALS